MRFQINGHSVIVYDAPNQRSILNTQSPTHENRVGIFWYGDKEYLGGWITMPLSFDFGFEALSYTTRSTRGRITAVEILVGSKEQLIQLAQLLIDNKKGWLTPKPNPSEALIYSIVDEMLAKIPLFIKEVETSLQKIQHDLTLEEALELDWNQTREQIEYFRYIIHSSDLPSDIDTFQHNINTLQSLSGQIDIEQIFSQVFNRELDRYENIYEKLSQHYQTQEFNLESLAAFIKEVQELQTEFNEALDQASQHHTGRNYINLFTNDTNQMKNDIQQFIQEIVAEQQELERVLQEQKELEALEQIILQQLKVLTPGIQTLLTRISELTGIDKQHTEQLILRLLEQHADLGTYDKTSQVFILGKNMPQKIETLLTSYKPLTLDESVVFLKSGKTLSPQELTFMVTQLFKKVEQVITTSIKTDDRIDFKDSIDLAVDQNIITNTQREQLHQFRMARNKFVHDIQDTIENTILVNAYQVFQQIKK